MNFAEVPFIVLLILLSAFCCWATLHVLRTILSTNYLAAQVQDRSNHKQKVRQLGGLALFPTSMIIAVIFCWQFGHWFQHNWVLILASTLLFLCGWRDDLKALSPTIRIFIQFIVSLIFIYILTPINIPFDYLIPRYLFMTLAILLLIYWINITNFMDGIDLMEVTGIGIPLMFVSIWLLLSGERDWLTFTGVATAGALFGFGVHNRPPAKVFLGDSGSLFCGLISAAIIYKAALEISPVVALLPFSYFLLDSGSTLLIRLMAGKNIFESHSEHAYQIAYRGKKSSKMICAYVCVLTLGLITLSIFSYHQKGTTIEYAALLVGFIFTAVLIVKFRNNKLRIN